MEMSTFQKFWRIIFLIAILHLKCDTLISDTLIRDNTMTEDGTATAIQAKAIAIPPWILCKTALNVLQTVRCLGY